MEDIKHIIFTSHYVVSYMKDGKLYLVSALQNESGGPDGLVSYVFSQNSPISTFSEERANEIATKSKELYGNDVEVYTISLTKFEDPLVDSSSDLED